MRPFCGGVERSGGRRRGGVRLASCALLLAVAGPASGASISGVRSWTAPDYTRIVLDLTGPAEYEVRRVGSPERIAVNVSGASIADAVPLPAGDDLVRAVRRSPLRGGAQIVIDLAERAGRFRHFRLKAADGRPERIVVDVFSAAPPAGAAPPGVAPAPASAAGAAALVDSLASAPVADSARSGAAGEPAARAAPAPAESVLAAGAADSLPAAGAPAAAGAGPGLEGRTAPYVVIVDAGHGGMDPGAIRGGLCEKDVTLEIGLELARLIDARPGWRAVLTRKGDYFVSLAERVRIAQKARGDIFISVHCNTHRQRTMDGMEVYFLSLQGATDREAQELADEENAADLVGLAPDEARDDSVLSILMDLRMTLVLDQSSRLAESILDAARGSGLVGARRVKQARFQVLRSLAMPSALVEMAYLSNEGDRQLLAMAVGRRRLASLVADGLMVYRGAGRGEIASGSSAGVKGRAQAGSGTAALGRPSGEAPSGPTWTRKYRVRRGDTLGALAQRHGTTIDAIRRHNGLKSERVRTGQVLRLPGAY